MNAIGFAAANPMLEWARGTGLANPHQAGSAGEGLTDDQYCQAKA